MSKIIAIDPGSEESAWVEWEDGFPLPNVCDKVPNSDLLGQIRIGYHDGCDVMVIEKAVCQKWSGSDVSKTMHYAGIFGGAWYAKYNLPVVYITRSKVRWTVCRTKKANDSMIRTALLGEFPKEWLTGYKYDIWQAGGVAAAFYKIMEYAQFDSLKIHKASREYINENTIGGNYGRVSELLQM